jgi:UrcA family protein
MSRAVLSALTGAALLLAATSALAEDGQMRVRVSDLNLASHEGARVAITRIRHDAGLFCQADEGRRTMGQTAAVSGCIADMSGKAVKALNAPLVTAMFQGEAQATRLAAR